MQGKLLTTVAASKKFGAIACDRQLTYKESIKMQSSSKILELPSPFVEKYFGAKKGFVGYAGNADIWSDVVSWIVLGTEGKVPKCKGIEFLCLTDVGLYHATTLTNWLELTDKHWSIGSGCPYAIAAMDNGADPLAACKAAGKRDVMTGMGYKNYTL